MIKYADFHTDFCYYETFKNIILNDFIYYLKYF